MISPVLRGLRAESVDKRDVGGAGSTTKWTIWSSEASCSVARVSWDVRDSLARGVSFEKMRSHVYTLGGESPGLRV